MEHLHDHFWRRKANVAADEPCGENTFAKTAPTNTAARINGGDTCHAFYKLPFNNLNSKKAILSAKVLIVLRQRIEP